MRVRTPSARTRPSPIRSRHTLAFVVLALLIAVVLAACTDDDSEPAATPTMTATATPTAGPVTADTDRPPAGVVSDGEHEYPLGLGTHCWSGPTSGMCVDMIGVITPTEAVSIARGATLQLVGGLAEPSITVASISIWRAPAEPIDSGDFGAAWQPESGESTLAMIGSQFMLPPELAPGRYILAINIVADPGGDAQYGLLVEAP